MKVCVFIPCHIYYVEQISLLDRCLNSLIHQTIIPDIYVSISLNNEFKKLFSYILHKYSDLVNFIFSKEQLYQMEHIYKLTKYATKYDMIMFCDDDDYYHKERVEIFIKSYMNSKLELKDLGGVKELDPESYDEYWCYGLVPKILFDFFAIFEKHNMTELLKHKFGDMYFRNYLVTRVDINKSFGYMGITLDNHLYIYNNNNPNSITRSLNNTSTEEQIESNLIMKIICCENDNKFNDIISQIPINEKQIFTTIYSFCKILYL